MKPKTVQPTPKTLASFANIHRPGFQMPALFHNDGQSILRDTGGGYKSGQIYFCNDTSRFLETYYSEPLTNYAVGWKDPNNIEASLEMVAPAVQVGGRRFEWKAAVNAEEFLSETVDDERAIGSDFKAVKYTGTDVTDKTHNRGLTLIVDLDDVPSADPNSALPPWQAQKVAKLLRRLYRNEFRRSISALQAAAVNVNYTWDKTNGVQPDVDVTKELLNATTLSGIRPNRVVYGDTAWFARRQTLSVQNAPGGYMGYGTDAMEAMAANLQVDEVYVSRERYQTGAATKAEILGNLIYLFFAESGVDTEDPSNIKRFISPVPGDQGGGLLRVYVTPIGAKLAAISVEFYSKIIVTYSGGIRQMTITGY